MKKEELVATLKKIAKTYDACFEDESLPKWERQAYGERSYGLGIAIDMLENESYFEEVKAKMGD